MRLRLTILYGALFGCTGAALLVITNVLFRNATGNYLLLGGPGRALFFSRNGDSGSAHNPSLHITPRAGAPNAQELHAQAQLLTEQARQQHAAEIHQLLVQSGITLAIMAIAAIALGWLVAGRALRPLRTINTTTRQITATNLHRRVRLEGPKDETTELAATIDDLLERLEASFDAQRLFVANASHELRTPLARQRTLIEVAIDDPDATVESLRQNHRRLLAAAEQQERLIEALLTLAKGERGVNNPASVDLASVACSHVE